MGKVHEACHDWPVLCVSNIKMGRGSPDPSRGADVGEVIRASIHRALQPPQPGSSVAVIGATGRLGRVLVRECGNQGFNVVAIAHSESEAKQKLGTPSDRMRIFIADVNDPSTVLAALKGVDLVFYVASARSFWNPFPRLGSPRRVEFEGVVPVVEYCNATDTHFVCMSTMYTHSRFSPIRWMISTRFPRWLRWVWAREDFVLKNSTRCSVFRVPIISPTASHLGVELGLERDISRQPVNPSVLARVMLRAILAHPATHGVAVDVNGNSKAAKPTLQSLDRQLYKLHPG